MLNMMHTIIFPRHPDSANVSPVFQAPDFNHCGMRFIPISAILANPIIQNEALEKLNKYNKI